MHFTALLIGKQTVEYNLCEILVIIPSYLTSQRTSNTPLYKTNGAHWFISIIKYPCIVDSTVDSWTDYLYTN